VPLERWADGSALGWSSVARRNGWLCATPRAPRRSTVSTSSAAPQPLQWTFLRDNIYLDFMPYFAGEDGVIRGPAGDGRAALVARDDIAAAATVVLTEDGHAGAVYDMTGSGHLVPP